MILKIDGSIEPEKVITIIAAKSEVCSDSHLLLCCLAHDVPSLVHLIQNKCSG
uniref:Uncharacterized protein n=1 Tax=Arundo donax TaxID=35708 RepID=A0A0A9FL93_ARUDO